MGDTCVQVWCGRRHTLVLVANPTGRSSGPLPRVLAFGYGADGQLGVPGQQRSFVPLVVKGVFFHRPFEILLFAVEHR